MRRKRFENFLGEVGDLPVGAAAAGSEDDEPIRALQEAVERLRSDPSLFSGDADGVYTYEDPILAIAHATAEASESLVGAAAADEIHNSQLLHWMVVGVRAFLARGDAAFAALGGLTPNATISFDEPRVRLAVIGDAGFRGTAQQRVLDLINRRHKEQPFDLLVHLGDTYYGGSDREFQRSLLAPLAKIDVRAVTLCGNHDLYFGPGPYKSAIEILRQPGRYFSIETPGFRIACLDTALGSERILRNDGKLDDGQLAWLDSMLEANDPRPIVLMSHHFIVSDWGTPAASLRAQLRDRIQDRVFAWYWGHEHSFVAYAKSKFGFHGACVGNGAFSEKFQPSRAKQPLSEWYPDERCDCRGDDQASSFWPHGYLELELASDRISETYRLESGSTYVRELSR